MPNFASATLIGHTGGDVELKYTQNDLAIATVNLAVNTGYGDRKVTSWYRLALFGKSAESFSKNVTKGKAIVVNGEIEIQQWQDKDGNPRQTVQVSVDRWSFAGGRDGAQGGNSDDYERHADDNNIPF